MIHSILDISIADFYSSFSREEEKEVEEEKGEEEVEEERKQKKKERNILNALELGGRTVTPVAESSPRAPVAFCRPPALRRLTALLLRCSPLARQQPPAVDVVLLCFVVFGFPSSSSFDVQWRSCLSYLYLCVAFADRCCSVAAPLLFRCSITRLRIAC